MGMNAAPSKEMDMEIERGIERGYLQAADNKQAEVIPCYIFRFLGTP